jgi:hypothetical protein
MHGEAMCSHGLRHHGGLDLDLGLEDARALGEPLSFAAERPSTLHMERAGICKIPLWTMDHVTLVPSRDTRDVGDHLVPV